MKRLDLSRYVVNEDYKIWRIDFAFSASFEVPIDGIQRVLPAGIHAIELRPGIALLNFSVFSFLAGNEMAEPCAEVAVSAHIIPNLALAPTLPRFSMYTFRLGATTRAFTDHATIRYPVFPDVVDVRIDRTRVAVEVRDRRGAPILSLAAAEGIPPRYDDDRFFAQSCATHDGRLCVGGNLFEFRRAENQRRLETGGGPHPHAFFGEIDVSGITPRHCYVQMWSEPGSVGREDHFFLRPLA